MKINKAIKKTGLTQEQTAVDWCYNNEEPYMG